jgi:hypothetical protein
MQPELVMRILRSSNGRFRYCYEKELQKNPGLGGTLHVRFVITNEGHVATSNADANTTGSDLLASCVTQGLMALEFPKPDQLTIVGARLVFTSTQ